MPRDPSRLIRLCLRFVRALLVAGAAALGPGLPPQPPPGPHPIELREARGPLLKRRYW
jgi:hypothetical protein